MSQAQRCVTICNARGLHARAAAKFVELAQSYRSQISVQREDETVSADSIMELLMLAAGKGSRIEIRANGEDSDQAVTGLAELVEAGFYEND